MNVNAPLTYLLWFLVVLIVVVILFKYLLPTVFG